MFRLSVFPALSLRRSANAGNGKNPLVNDHPEVSVMDAREQKRDEAVLRRVSERVSQNTTGSLAAPSSRRNEKALHR